MLYERDEGKSHRERNPKVRILVRPVNRTPPTRGVHFLETGNTLTSYEESETESLHVIEDGSIPTEDLPSTDDGEDSVMYIGRHVLTKRLSYEGMEVNMALTGWKEVRSIICHLFYGKGYISSRYTATMRDLDKVIDKYQEF